MLLERRVVREQEKPLQADERQKIVLELLAAKGQLAITDISSRFAVSEMTVRRDLAQLESEGLLRRTHGGAVRTHSGSFEPPFALRARQNREGKRAIALGIAAELSDGETVILDGGSTGTAVAEALVGRSLTVCTLSMRAAEILAGSAATRVMIPGGFIRHGELSVVGAAAERTLADHRFDTYVMTVSALDAEAGLTEWNVEDAAVKRAALANAARCLVACDSTKFGQTAFARIASATEVDLIMTDGQLKDADRRALTDAGAVIRTV